MKRSSTRNVVLSKAMKHVDEETRREFREKRLQALECDNYVEMEAAQQEDDAYNESEDEKGGATKRKRAKVNQKNDPTRSKWATKVVKPLERILLDNGIVHERYVTRGSSAVDLTAMDVDEDEESSVQEQKVTASSSSRGMGKAVASASSLRDAGGRGGKGGNDLVGGRAGSSSSRKNLAGGGYGGEVNYHTIAAKPSVIPARQCFCSVCGYIGNYTCTRCGSKFCSIKCNESHKETRCFKFSM